MHSEKQQSLLVLMCGCVADGRCTVRCWFDGMNEYLILIVSVSNIFETVK